MTTTTTTTTTATTATATTVTILAGLADRHSVPFTHGPAIMERRVRQLLTEIGELAGGFTLTETHGGWTNEDGELQTERSMKIETTITATPERTRKAIGTLLFQVWGFLVQTDQECVLIHTPKCGWITFHRSDPVHTTVHRLVPGSSPYH